MKAHAGHAHGTHVEGRGMRPLPPLLPFEDAREKALRAVRPIGRTEAVPLLEAAGRVAARDVRSRIDVPLADRAAMDGYAVVARDTEGASPSRPAVLRRIGVAYAGPSADLRVSPGTCVEVATGATMPRGADAVVMVERTEAHGDAIRVLAPVDPGRNVSRRGEDIRRGTVVVRSGDVLTPGRIGALAAVGEVQVRVYGRPKVAILTTGDEVVRPGTRIRPGQVYDINSQTLATLVRDHGGEAVLRGRTKDHPAPLRAAIREAVRSADLVVVSGGSSVGARDLLADVLDEVLFHGVAVKPGRPTILGRIGRRTVLGMPGYPTSCLSNGYVLLAPMLRRLARLPPAVDRTVDVPLADRIESPSGKLEVHTVRIVDGRAVSAWKESSTITSMSEADGYVVIPADVMALEAGTRVRVILF